MDAFWKEIEGLPIWGKVATGAIVLGGPLVAYLFYKKRPRKSPVKEDWKRDMIYLYQFPPAATIPNLSPYCLKLETWLRMEKLPYENVPAKMSLRSREGMLPFIELNGMEYCDSSFIIRDLSRLFDKKEHLSPEQDGTSRAFEQMVENNTIMSYAYVRYIEQSDVLLSEEVLGTQLPFLFRLMMPARFMRNGVRSKLWHHGIGRHTRDEIVNIGLDDLRAISMYLGDKKYMNGDEPTRVDATLFGHLAQMVFVSIESPHRDLLREECTNLVQYCNRIREEFWPDWYTVRETRPIIW